MATYTAPSPLVQAEEGLDILISGAKRLLEKGNANAAYDRLTHDMIKAGGFEAESTKRVVRALTAAVVRLAEMEVGDA